MQRLLALAKLANELLDAIAVKERLRLLVVLVLKHNFNARIQKRQFAQAVGQNVEFEFRRDGENCRVGFERDQRACFF